jgi:hypothetical protein
VASEDLDDDGVESGERLARRRRSESTVVLSDSSDKESALLDQPTGGDADASSSRDLEEEGRLARLEAERRSKFNDERASRRQRRGLPTARSRPANPLRLHHQPRPSQARGGVTPRNRA